MELTESQVKEYMERCIELAKRTPSSIQRPHVGALVLSADGRIVGEGYRRLLDVTSLTVHAERVALDEAENQSTGGILFTTLEPCVVMNNRRFVFDSCCNLIVERRIRKVYYGLEDSSPYTHSGAGVSYLITHGIEVHKYDTVNNLILKDLMPLAYTQKRTHRNHQLR